LRHVILDGTAPPQHVLQEALTAVRERLGTRVP
jgi:hypothetical protein